MKEFSIKFKYNKEAEMDATWEVGEEPQEGSEPGVV